MVIENERTNWRARRTGTLLALACLLALLPGPGAVHAQDGEDDDDTGADRRYCSATAMAAFRACEHEVRDDYQIARGICINVSDEAERTECVDEAREARREGLQECDEQLGARRAVCDALGEGRYDPAFDPADFDDDFQNLTRPNPYRPLQIGQRWEYRGGTETISIEVRDETKLIEGVTCIVVRDQVFEAGVLIEDTDDWFAQAKNGDVYYCGEEAKDFETFAGDVPPRPELVSIDGSFKAGRDGDKPGILFLGTPVVGAVHRQEFSLGNAEDVAEVLSTTYAFGTDPTLDAFVPPALAMLLCAGDCVVMKEFTPLSPGGIEHKYFAPGIGLFLEVDPEDGSGAQLVGCNFDPRCAMLPAP